MYLIYVLVNASAAGQQDTTAAHRIEFCSDWREEYQQGRKLMKCGGIRGAREIALIAANAGIDLFWGCNNESCASITAALHVAYSCSSTKYLDLDGSFDLSSDYVTGGLILKNGIMYCSELPGLGLKKR
jgi:L-alanine-DL-glutamate epimerase-like enolase superfamily enzyme